MPEKASQKVNEDVPVWICYYYCTTTVLLLLVFTSLTMRAFDLLQFSTYLV